MVFNHRQVEAEDGDRDDDNSRVSFRGGSKELSVTAEGNVVLQASLDREARTMHKISVVAFDSGDPSLSSSAEVVVRVLDQNDQAPLFKHHQFHFEVLENQQAGTLVGRVEAEDHDLAPFNATAYRLKNPSSRSPFRLDAATGKIFSTNTFDREQQGQYRFEVLAVDEENEGLQSSALVLVTVLDVNDNQPVFHYPGPENHTLRLPEASRGIVARIRASDPDHGRNGQVEYEILDGNQAGLFEVNSITGDLVLLQPLHAFPNHSSWLVLAATDLGTPSLRTSSSLTLLPFYQSGLQNSRWRWLLQKLLLRNVKKNAVWLVACVSGVIVALLLVAITSTLLWQRRRRKGERSGDQKHFFCNKHAGQQPAVCFSSEVVANSKGKKGIGSKKEGEKPETKIIKTTAARKKKDEGLSPEVSRKIDLTLHSSNTLSILF